MNKYSKERKEWVRDSKVEALELAKEYQKLLLDAIRNDYVDKLQLHGKKIIFNAKNLSTIQDLDTLLNQVANLKGNELIKWFFQQGQAVAKLNLNYFNSVLGGGTLVAYDNASRLMFLRLGFDDGKIIKNTPLWDLSRIEEPIRRIKAEAIRAITQGQTWGEFRTGITNFVTGTETGIVENHMKTNAFDTFNQMDRTMQFEMSTSLGLDYFLYSEGLKETSRQFCKDRVGKAFTRAEVLKWADLEFQGKPKENYDPFIDVGGYNCEHQLDAVTKDVWELYKN